ncbi:ras family protein, partial [Flagelloscypha sp. PMI_526]
VVDVMTRELLVDGQQFSLNGSEACSSEEYERIRPLQYRNPSTSPDVVLICFSVVVEWSYKDVKGLRELWSWAPEIQQHCPNVPVILVGMKIDLRQDEAVIESCRRKHAGPIEFEQGAAMAREIGAVAYLECSTLTEDGLEELFERLCRVYLSECSVLLFSDFKYAY